MTTSSVGKVGETARIGSRGGRVHAARPFRTMLGDAGLARGLGRGPRPPAPRRPAGVSRGEPVGDGLPATAPGLGFPRRVGRPAPGGPALHRRQRACRALARCAGVPRLHARHHAQQVRRSTEAALRCKEKEALPWDEEAARALEAGPDESGSAELRATVQSLPLDQQRVLDGIYTQGRTYQEVSDDTGIPLGTMKRRLRDAILALRRRFADA